MAKWNNNRKSENNNRKSVNLDLFWVKYHFYHRVKVKIRFKQKMSLFTFHFQKIWTKICKIWINHCFVSEMDYFWNNRRRNSNYFCRGNVFLCILSKYCQKLLILQRMYVFLLLFWHFLLFSRAISWYSFVISFSHIFRR